MVDWQASGARESRARCSMRAGSLPPSLMRSDSLPFLSFSLSQLPSHNTSRFAMVWHIQSTDLRNSSNTTAVLDTRGVVTAAGHGPDGSGGAGWSAEDAEDAYFRNSRGRQGIGRQGSAAMEYEIQIDPLTLSASIERVGATKSMLVDDEARGGLRGTAPCLRAEGVGSSGGGKAAAASGTSEGPGGEGDGGGRPRAQTFWVAVRSPSASVHLSYFVCHHTPWPPPVRPPSACPWPFPSARPPPHSSGSTPFLGAKQAVDVVVGLQARCGGAGAGYETGGQHCLRGLD